jgi:tetrapyrrole methylase family protein/MazG family protein
MPKRSFDDLVSLMTTLRGPSGCPWDRKQTLPDLKPYVIEEAYEVVDAIDRNDRDSLVEEVGDMLLEAVFIGEVTRVRHLRLNHRSARQARAPSSARLRRHEGE